MENQTIIFNLYKEKNNVDSPIIEACQIPHVDCLITIAHRIENKDDFHLFKEGDYLIRNNYTSFPNPDNYLFNVINKDYFEEMYFQVVDKVKQTTTQELDHFKNHQAPEGKTIAVQKRQKPAKTTRAIEVLEKELERLRKPIENDEDDDLIGAVLSSRQEVEILAALKILRTIEDLYHTLGEISWN